MAVWINVAAVLLGSLVGLLVKNRFSQRASQAVISALSLCTVGVGLSTLLKTEDTLCLIICSVVGTLIGEGIGIEKRIDGAGEALRKKLVKGDGESRFVEGFVTATVLYCVGAMAINGSIQAGLNGDYGILMAKSVMDGVSAITFAAAMGLGVAVSAVPILLYEGALTLLAGVVGPYLGAAVINEMSAVGGAIIVGIAFNMLGMPKEKIRVGNMLPAIFLPILYIPLVNWIGGLLG